MSYAVTGTFKGRRFYYPTPDYAFAVKLFTVNALRSLWSIDSEGKRKLLKRN